MGFKETFLDIRTFRDGSDDELNAPLHFYAADGSIFRCPIGSKTDGMSLPKVVRMIPGFNANRQDWFPAILHDGGYRGTLEKWDGEGWIPAKLTRKQADGLIRESMQTNRIKQAAVYWPLRVCGWPNFKGG
jgi:hypothetical protein